MADSDCNIWPIIIIGAIIIAVFYFLFADNSPPVTPSTPLDDETVHTQSTEEFRPYYGRRYPYRYGYRGYPYRRGYYRYPYGYNNYYNYYNRYPNYRPYYSRYAYRGY